MKKRTIFWIVIAAVILVGAILLALPKKEAPHTDTVVQQISEISVTVPAGNAVVGSPVSIAGSANGSWYFEASFPIIVVDWDGRIIGEGHAQAAGDWMTDKAVPFSASVSFTAPACGATQDYCHRGAIIFKNDNPSGDPARSKSFELPVMFK